MSTKKITALTELSATPATTDMIPIVDVSDTTDAATGTTKKISALNVGKASIVGIGIGAGNTTAEPVKIDTSSGEVGIGTDAPDTFFHIEKSCSGIASAQIRLTEPSDAREASIFNNAGDLILATHGTDNATDGKIVINEAGTISFSTGSDDVADMTIATNSKVGIGATSPSVALHVASSGFTSHLERFPGASTDGPGLNFLKSRGSAQGAVTVVTSGDVLGTLQFKGADGSAFVEGARVSAIVDNTPGSNDMPAALTFATTPDGASTPTEKMRIDNAGNMLLGGTATPTSSAGNMCFFNGTAPAASVTNGVVLYAEDVSTSELRVRDEAGNVATLSPHNFELLGERSEPMAWSYANKNVFVGKEVNVDMMKVIRALEKLTGEEYIKIRDIAKSEKLDWVEEEKRKEAEQKKEIDSYKSRKAENAAHPTNSSTKAEVKAYLDKSETEYEDAAKEELFKLVPEKEEFTEVEPAAYSKKSKPSWIG